MTTLGCVITESGKLPPAVATSLTGIISKLANKRVQVTIEEFDETRSPAQNRYWWAMVEKHLKEHFNKESKGEAWSSEDIHAYIMVSLGYIKTLHAPDGSTKHVRLSSKKFTTAQWEAFMEKAREHCAREYNIMIPLPNENDNYFTKME